MDPQVEARLIVGHRCDACLGGELTAYINQLIDAGEFCPGYELAVGELTASGYSELMDLLMQRNQERMPLFEAMARTMSKHGADLRMGFAMVDDENVVCTNGWKIVRLERGELRWSSVPYLCEGMNNLTVDGGLVRGSWLAPQDTTYSVWKWEEFALDYQSGERADGSDWTVPLKR